MIKSSYMPASIGHWKIGEEFQVKFGQPYSSAPDIYGDSSGRKGLGETPQGSTRGGFPAARGKRSICLERVYQHTLRHTDLALSKPKQVYKNRVLKILVSLGYREKLDTNVIRILISLLEILC